MDRWQRINELFHSALERAPGERAAFLAEVCADDEPLRREVESLLKFHEQAESFIETPAFDVAAEMFAKGQRKLEVGQQIGYYKVTASLGAGGMGEVYLAEDARLSRKVALKLLPVQFTIDSERASRFKQEARAVSALNHPNIVTIYEIGRADSINYIATEFIDGVTLRERITSHALRLGEALEVASQIASALSAAHAAGIVHRDIKPENVMLRPDGFVKVLDFGLAKLTTQQAAQVIDTQAPTKAMFKTSPGIVMGTVQYMSPEQARGAQVDHRTDIWSLGVVLYEMVTGHVPFDGETSSHVIVSILESEPTQLDRYSEAPVELERIIRKALRKDREERYQSADDLALDLKSLRQELEAEARLNRSLHTDVSDRERETKSEDQAVEIVQKPAAQTVAAAHPTSSAEYLVGEIKRHKTATTLIIMALSIAAIAAIILRFYPSRTSQPMKISSLTNSGKSVCAAISPDGKHVAHAEEADGKQALLFTSIATAGASQIVSPDDVNYLGLTFSHDGEYLYFVRTERPSDVGQLYQVALPSSAPRKLLVGVDSPVTFSPNGDRFAFVRFNKNEGEYALMLANADGSGERTLATRRDGNNFSLDGVAWSPDGRTIACAAGHWDSGHHMNLIEVDVADGLEKSVGAQEWFYISQVAWVEDGSELIISASEQPTANSQLWRVSYPQGKAVKITNGITSYESVSLSRNANLLVSVQSSNVSQIWVAPGGDATRARAIASKVGFNFGLSWASNGKIVFSSMAGGNLNISSVNADGSDQRQLTVNAGDNYNPATSPDGRYIVFASNRTGTFNIWRMNAEDGGNLKQLTFSDGNFYPSCSQDNQWVVYDNQDRARTTVWKVPIGGGDAIQLTENNARMPVVSPDNQFIACRYYPGNGVWDIAIIPLQGGAPVKLLPIPVIQRQRIQWTADGRALTYINNVNGAWNIWSYDIESGQSEQLTDFKTDRIFSYDWSPDFTQLACERGNTVRDVLIISNFR